MGMFFLDLSHPGGRGDGLRANGAWCPSPLHLEGVMGMQPYRVGAASPALASGSSQQVALIIYVVLLAGLKSSHHSEVRRGESVQLGKTQPLIFYMMIFHYSAIFKSKKYFFFPCCSKPLFIPVTRFPKNLDFFLGGNCYASLF